MYLHVRQIENLNSTNDLSPPVNGNTPRDNSLSAICIIPLHSAPTITSSSSSLSTLLPLYCFESFLGHRLALYRSICLQFLATQHVRPTLWAIHVNPCLCLDNPITTINLCLNSLSLPLSTRCLRSPSSAVALNIEKAIPKNCH